MTSDRTLDYRAPEETRIKARAGLQAVADWAVRNQCRHRWPLWCADTGRFPYRVHLPNAPAL